MRHQRLPAGVISNGPAPLAHWHGHALVIGAGGIGQALVAALHRRAPGLQVLSAGPRRGDLRVDLTDDDSIARLADIARGRCTPLRLVIHTAGLLHGEGLQPEKRLSQVTRSNLERGFAVNAFAPLLLAQALEPCFPRDAPVHFASLSARVGSIADNHLGGWYAYRAAKAAQNQLLRTLSIEWARRLPLACVTLLHPGTTATDLSQPFQANVPPQRLFSPERAADQLLDVLERQSPAQSGSFLAWDGTAIPW